MKAGDLVRVQKWCKEKGRLAHIVEEFWFDSSRVMIQFMDSRGLTQDPIEALKINLILVNSA